MVAIEALGLHTSVCVDGTPLPEYDDPDPDVEETANDGFTLVSNKYVESDDGAEFSVTCSVSDWSKPIYQHPDPAFQLVVVVYVDGKRVRGVYYGPAHSSAKFEGIEAIDRFDGLLKLRRFKFAPITTIDDADKATIKDDTERAKDLGLIKVVVRRALQGPTAHSGEPSMPPIAGFSYAEKALKGRAVSHGTSSRHSHDAKDLDSYPIAIFNIKYRSRASLHAEMVIPPSPSPGAANIADLSAEELRRLAQERLDQLRDEKKPVIKREIGEVVDLTEHGDLPRPLKIARTNREDPIDLTDD